MVRAKRKGDDEKMKPKGWEEQSDLELTCPYCQTKAYHPAMREHVTRGFLAFKCVKCGRIFGKGEHDATDDLPRYEESRHDYGAEKGELY